MNGRTQTWVSATHPHLLGIAVAQQVSVTSWKPGSLGEGKKKQVPDLHSTPPHPVRVGTDFFLWPEHVPRSSVVFLLQESDYKELMMGPQRQALNLSKEKALLSPGPSSEIWSNVKVFFLGAGKAWCGGGVWLRTCAVGSSSL